MDLAWLRARSLELWRSCFALSELHWRRNFVLLDELMSDGYYSFQMKWCPQTLWLGWYCYAGLEAVISPALLVYLLLHRDRLYGIITFGARPIYPFAPLFSKFYDLSLANNKFFTYYKIYCLIHRWKFCPEMKANWIVSKTSSHSQIHNPHYFSPKNGL